MKILLTFSLIAALTACASKKQQEEATEVVSTEKEMTEGKPQRPYQVAATIGEIPARTDAYEIKDVRLEGNLLYIDVTYGGGCAWHKFECIGSRAVSKSIPPKRAIKLLHDNDDDQCKSIVMQTVEVDLRALAQKQETGSEIVLNLEGYSEEIKYVYE